MVVKSALAQAKKANIPVVDAFDLSSPSAPLSPPGLSGEHDGRLRARRACLGDYIVAHVGSTSPHVLVFGDSSFPSVASITGGAVSEVKKLLPNSTIISKNVPVGQIATQLGDLTQSSLRADPDIKWVVAGYDAEAICIVPAIQQAGLAGKVNVVGHDAVPQNLKWVQTSHIQMFDVGDPTGWGGWSGIARSCSRHARHAAGAGERSVHRFH